MQQLANEPSFLEVSRAKWTEASGKILKQAEIERSHKMKLNMALESIEEFGMFKVSVVYIPFITMTASICTFCGDECLKALIVLPYLLPDAKYGADHEKIICFAEVWMVTTYIKVWKYTVQNILKIFLWD